MAFIIYESTGKIGAIKTLTQTGDQGIYCDSHANLWLIDDIHRDPTTYLVIDGVLTRDGAPVPINPPCSDCQVLDAVVGDVPATVEQLQAAVRLLILKPGFQRG